MAAAAGPWKPDVTSSIQSIRIGQHSISNWKGKFLLEAVGGEATRDWPMPR
jgi:polyisoprenoid-binding protein YceI